MALRKMKKKERKPSSVFSMFDEKQVQKFKAAFDVIDANNDGYIDKDDLLKTYEAFAITPSIEQITEMLCGQEKISFTYFLVIFGEKLINMDRDSVIKQAFETLDQEGLGKIDVDILREQLTTMGDRLTDEECAEFLKDDAAYIDRKSNTFDYDKFISKMTAGAEKD